MVWGCATLTATLHMLVNLMILTTVGLYHLEWSTDVSGRYRCYIMILTTVVNLKFASFLLFFYFIYLFIYFIYLLELVINWKLFSSFSSSNKVSLAQTCKGYRCLVYISLCFLYQNYSNFVGLFWKNLLRFFNEDILWVSCLFLKDKSTSCAWSVVDLVYLRGKTFTCLSNSSLCNVCCDVNQLSTSDLEISCVNTILAVMNHEISYLYVFLQIAGVLLIFSFPG